MTFQRHSALVSLLRLKDELEEKSERDDKFGVSIEGLSAAMADVGNNWERVPLRHAEGREGWEDALMGCLKDVGRCLCPCCIILKSISQHATLANFPRLQEILTRLLFAPEPTAEPLSSSSSSSRVSTPLSSSLTQRSTPGERYYCLPAEDRIAILSFMCNMAISSKAIHGHMETCEEQLTSLRKEKIEVNRLKKQ